MQALAQNVILVSSGILQQGPQLALMLRSEFALDIVGKDIKAWGRCSHHWGWGHCAWASVGGKLHMAKVFALRRMAKAACSWGQAEASAR